MSADVTQRIRLDDQAFVVTGAGGGIGGGIVAALVDAGASVIAQVRNRGLPTELHGPQVIEVVADLADPDVPEELVRTGLERFGRIDGAVNNAGIQTLVPYQELTDDDWSTMLGLNLGAARRLTDSVARSVGPQGASVVHISSIEARHPTTMHGHYATAKAALVMHAKAAALALGPKGVRVNVILPGLIDRPGLDQDWPEGVARWQAAAPLGRLGTPSDVGDGCVFLCSAMARWITGAELVIDGGVLTNPTW